MSMPLAKASSSKSSFALPLTLLSFGVISLLLLSATFTIALPSIAQNWFRNPWALLPTHLFTLGYVTAIIMGAVYQLVPVILETNLWSERLGWAHLITYLLGVTGLLIGFTLLAPTWLIWGGIFTVVGVALFLINTFITMAKAQHWHHSATYLLCSLTYLGLVVALGLTLAYNLRAGFLGASTRDHLIIHAVLGFGGWFTLTIMGVAYKLIPLFTLSHHEPSWRTWLALALTNFGILGLSTTISFKLGTAADALMLAAGAVGILLFLSEVYEIVKNRVRQEIDLGVRFALVSCLFLVAGLALALVYLLPGVGSPARAVGLLWATGMGWVSLMIVGQMYKIVPFLIWTARYAPKVGREKVPSLREMFDQALAERAFWLLLAGTTAVLVGLWLPWLPLAMAGGLVTVIGTALFARGIYSIMIR